jgi:hypothetical protein
VSGPGRLRWMGRSSYQSNLGVLRLRQGRNSSRTVTFDAAEGEVIVFRCTGKRFLPIFLASFVVPGLALTLRRE